jgi:hypothetical protein
LGARVDQNTISAVANGQGGGMVSGARNCVGSQRSIIRAPG